MGNNQEVKKAHEDFLATFRRRAGSSLDGSVGRCTTSMARPGFCAVAHKGQFAHNPACSHKHLFSYAPMHMTGVRCNTPGLHASVQRSTIPDEYN
jgi:hypothetical protein